MTRLSLSAALNSGLRQVLEQDPKAVVMGEDVGPLGGVFRVTDGLSKDFGSDRVIDTPLAESSIVGTAIGLAMRGYHPVCEIQFDGFVYPAFNQIVSQLAKMRARTGGRVPMPVVIRIPCGGGIGAVEHHSESNEAYFAHTAGLRVVICSDPQSGHYMLRQALACGDPVIFYEQAPLLGEGRGLHRPVAGPGLRQGRGGPGRLRRHHGLLRRDGGHLPGGGPDRRGGGPLAGGGGPALAVAAGPGHGVCLGGPYRPLPGGARGARVRRAGGRGGQRGHRALLLPAGAPVLRVTGFDLPYPPAKFEEQYLPDTDRVLAAVDKLLEF